VNTVSGRVTRTGGGAASDAVVELHNATHDVVDQVTVDDDGRYVYHLARGKWLLRAWDARGGRARAVVELAADEDKTLNLELGEDSR
jgi:hypothetical protein